MAPSLDDQLALLRRGAAEEIPKGGLAGALARAAKEGRPLRVKFGIDPSSADLHLGHTVPLRKLKAFQDLGHEVVFLIGDFTAMIGDPTGRNAARPQLTAAQVEVNAKTYLDQVWKVLDQAKTTVRRNSEWCDKMTFADVIKLASKQNVARILERDDFMKRYKAGQPIAVHEFLYPLVQGYDSVVLKADVELCSTDQIFNCHVGRALQEADGQPPEVILAMPLIEGTDGVAKMSKSDPEHAIGITDPPDEMFGKLMSIPDHLVEKYSALLLDHPPVQQTRDRVHDEGMDKEQHMADKAGLAIELVRNYHGWNRAETAVTEFARTVVRREAPSNIAAIPVSATLLSNGMIEPIKLLVVTGMATSRSDADRLIKQHAVELDGSTIMDSKVPVRVDEGAVLKVGKRRYAQLLIAP